jgi:hypothetical protein
MKRIELDKDKPSHMIFEIKNKTEDEILEPIFEIYRGKLFSKLIKLFTDDCINTFGTEIFSIKKSFSRTLTNILSGWMFSLYISYDYSGDYFFPSNYHNMESLLITLNDFCKYDITIKNKDDKIKKILDNLKSNYKFQLDLLSKYRLTSTYSKNKNNYKIKKSMIKIKKNTNECFYKFDIIIPFIIKDKRLNNILNNILIPTKIYEKIIKNYSGTLSIEDNNVDEYIWAIIFRYQLLGSNNHQLAVLPSIMSKMSTDYGLNFECFASTINCTFPNYCSLYYDLEKHFGSVGNFFNIQPIKGTFGFNPPYQKNVIDNGISNILKYIEQTTDNLTFIITIPIWDSIGQEYMKNEYNNNFEKQTINYGEFEIMEEIRDSKYFKGLRMIPKEKFTYVDHNFELYKNKTIQNTYVIFISNQDISLESFNNYDFFNINESHNIEQNALLFDDTNDTNNIDL